ncbi:MAG: PhzF family phenazine biosynthesis protein [Woeseiaceae bacterium]|jgi:PhzF family phenazine biosynthesis protein
MNIPIYQVDAFTLGPFSGNPAAVCPLDAWLDDTTMQSIAAENNLAETAFIVASDEGYDLRWFTPAIEVDLCGHATLAAGYVILNHLQPDLDAVAFETLSGRLIVTRDGDRLSMDFPARAPTPVAVSQALIDALGEAPSEVHASRDILAVYDDEARVRALSPDQARLLALDEGLGVIATARGDAVDFVSRFFVPKAGIAEDPVTGSAHCTLVPFWAERLGKLQLVAHQVSPRGGELHCEHRGDRVIMSGQCTLFLTGSIHL